MYILIYIFEVLAFSQMKSHFYFKWIRCDQPLLSLLLSSSSSSSLLLLLLLLLFSALPCIKLWSRSRFNLATSTYSAHIEPVKKQSDWLNCEISPNIQTSRLQAQLQYNLLNHRLPCYSIIFEKPYLAFERPWFVVFKNSF